MNRRKIWFAGLVTAAIGVGVGLGAGQNFGASLHQPNLSSSTTRAHLYGDRGRRRTYCRDNSGSPATASGTARWPKAGRRPSRRRKSSIIPFMTNNCKSLKTGRPGLEELTE